MKIAKKKEKKKKKENPSKKNKSLVAANESYAVVILVWPCPFYRVIFHFHHYVFEFCE